MPQVVVLEEALGPLFVQASVSILFGLSPLKIIDLAREKKNRLPVLNFETKTTPEKKIFNYFLEKHGYNLLVWPDDLFDKEPIKSKKYLICKINIYLFSVFSKGLFNIYYALQC